MQVLHGIGILSLVWSWPACQNARIADLPSVDDLGAPRGGALARVLLHLHSPFSWDACDQKPELDRGECRQNLLDALCENRIDLAFLTDHPDRMASTPIEDLTLRGPDVDLVSDSNSGLLLGEVSSCRNTHRSWIAPGLEGTVMGLGMSIHLDSADQTGREELYSQSSAEWAQRLQSEAGALAWMPHPESKSAQFIHDSGVQGLESFNLHALLDPEIRHSSLRLAPLDSLFGVLGFAFDPFFDLNSDSMFLHFLQAPARFIERWNEVIELRNSLGESMNFPAWGASDSHEYLFPQTGSDGRRLDVHARMTRLVVNHVWVTERTPSSIRQAIQEGSGWLVFESLGSPVGMDFSLQSTTQGQTYGPGQTLEVPAEQSIPGLGLTLTVTLPRVYRESTQREGRAEAPRLRVRVFHLSPGQTTEVVLQEAWDESVSETITLPGTYRAEVSMIPRHLRGVAAPYSERALLEFPWIQTNRIEVREASSLPGVMRTRRRR